MIRGAFGGLLGLLLAACAPSPEPSEGHGHAQGASHDGHTDQMSATRERLRSELGAAYDEPVAGLDAADPARGRAIYEQTCAACHGEAGKGDGPAAAALSPRPADFTDAFHARYYSDAARVRIIEQGSPGTAMVGFGDQLDHQQILDAYAYVRSLRPDAATAPTGGHGGHAH